MTIEKISEALNAVSEKKESLRQSFLQLQTHSLSLSSFPLTWPQIDSHFSSIESSLRSQFDAIKSATPQKPITSSALMSPNATVSRQVRPELKDLCEKMDGRGLRRYVDDHHNELISIKEELNEALKSATDPALMVLNAMDDFYSSDVKAKGNGDGNLRTRDVRKTCVMLLEKLMNIAGTAGISETVKERAKNLAIQWKAKVNQKDSDSFRALGFLTLLSAYNLGSEFDENEIIDLLVNTAPFKEATSLCRILIMPDKIRDVVHKLIQDGKQLLAVKFIFEFSLADKFPPVPLLKAYVIDIKQSAKSIREKGNHSLRAMNEAAVKEVNALKSVLKYIEEHKLESEYPPKILENRIKEINSKTNNKKRSAEDMVHGKMQQQNNRRHKTQQLDGSNQSHNTSIATHTTFQMLPNVHSSLRPYQSVHLPAAAPSTATPYMIPKPEVSGFSGPNQNYVQYLGNQNVASYSGTTPAVNPNGSSVIGAYSSAGGTIVHPAQLSPKSSNVYIQEAQLPSAYYSTATAYGGGYNVPPQYHPQYYPQ